MYFETFNISHTLAANTIVDDSDVVGASIAGAAPTTSSFLTKHLASMDWAETTARQDEKHLVLRFGMPYSRGLMVCVNMTLVLLDFSRR